MEHLYYLYILYSKTIDKYYIGVANNPENRLKKHNTNHKGFTGTTNDWSIVFEQLFESKSLALKKEKEIKKKKSRKYIEYLVANYN